MCFTPYMQLGVSPTENVIFSSTALSISLVIILIQTLWNCLPHPHPIQWIKNAIFSINPAEVYLGHDEEGKKKKNLQRLHTAY